MADIELKPDLDLVERWMRGWPGLPIIVAIRIDPATGVKGLVEGKCFVKAGCPADGNPEHTDYLAMRRWIWERQGGGAYWANIYFHPNGLRRPIDGKAKATDVGYMNTIHVDVDCRPGEDQETGIARIVELLKSLKTKDGQPAMPSDIVTSGGGAQAYWRLGAPVPVNGDSEIFDDLKLYNKFIEQDCQQGDACHSLDHIMRLPGTINIPDKKKMEKGRKPRVAGWPFHDDGKRYSLAQFNKAAPENKAAIRRAFAKDGDAAAVDFTIEPEILPSDPRLFSLPDKWKTLGLEGDTLGEYTGLDGKTDRSGMAFAFVTACMRCSPPVNDDLIASIIMDKGWKVGECIRDKGVTVQRHLRRIVERARAFVLEDGEKACHIDLDKPDEILDKLLIRVLNKGIIYYREEWYLFDGRVWNMAEERAVRKIIRMFLLSCKIRVSMKVKEKDDKGKAHIKTDNDGKPELEWKTIDCAPTRAIITEVMEALCERVLLHKSTETPCWIEPEKDLPPAHECMRLSNGILHVPTRRLVDHDANLFSTSITSYPYDPEARCPLWRATLEQYWPASLSEDGKTLMLEPRLLQEMFGYSLTPWTSLQKLMAVVGPGRSGKGTISKVLEAVVGRANISAPSFGALATVSGQMSLINKSLAVIGEAAFGARDDRAAITNLLKTVSGEDTINVPRKFLSDWSGRLFARFWLFCNQIPNCDDAGNAIMARILPLRMVRSWAGKENENLAKQLDLETSGILNWALEGYDRLLGKGDDCNLDEHGKPTIGKFTMPDASTETKELFGDLASPLNDFLNDWCVVTGKPEHSVLRGDLYLAYLNWCESVHTHPKSMGKAIEAIMSLMPEKLKHSRKGGRGEERARCIVGLTLVKPPEDMSYHHHRKNGRSDSSNYGEPSAPSDGYGYDRDSQPRGREYAQHGRDNGQPRDRDDRGAAASDLAQGALNMRGGRSVKETDGIPF